MTSMHEQIMGFRWVKCQKVRGQGSLTPELTGMTVYRQRGGGERGAQREGETQGEGEGARWADVPCLLSFLVRAQVWTVMCMLVDVTSGLQGTQAWVSPDPGGWHWGVKSGYAMGRRAPHGEVAMDWTKKHCELPDFSVCCQTSNYKQFFLIPCWLHVRYRKTWTDNWFKQMLQKVGCL